MKKLLVFFLAFALMACAAPATEIAPTKEVPSATAAPSLAPIATPEPKTFFKVFGEEPIVPRGSHGAWDDRFTDPGAVVFHDQLVQLHLLFVCFFPFRKTKTNV